jgi:hypothetical protein
MNCIQCESVIRFILKKKINWIIRLILSFYCDIYPNPICYQTYIKHMIGYIIIMSISYPVFIQLYIISCLYVILTIKRTLIFVHKYESLLIKSQKFKKLLVIVINLFIGNVIFINLFFKKENLFIYFL